MVTEPYKGSDSNNEADINAILLLLPPLFKGKKSWIKDEFENCSRLWQLVQSPDVMPPNWHNAGSAWHIGATFVLQAHILQETMD